MGISSRSHDDIGAGERSIPTLHKKAGGLTRDSRDTDASQDRHVEVSSVAFQIVRQFILTRKRTLSHGQWQPGQRVVLRGENSRKEGSVFVCPFGAPNGMKIKV